MLRKPKIVVILGPTASGKSDLAVSIAKKLNGEVISADSRQVYKYLNIGTGKITKKEMGGVPHYLLDIVSPKKTFTAQQFKIQAEKAIQKIIKNKKLPIICGGTGFYIQTIVDNISFHEVPPNLKLRKKLKQKTTNELFERLLQIDPKRAATIDKHNPHRLVRAIEIAEALGKSSHLDIQCPKLYNALQIGVETDDITLKERIYKRLIARLKKGMIREVEKLHEQGLSWKRMEELGLEYRYLARFLQGKISRVEMIDLLNREIWRYAKRQRTWFKRDKRIHWFKLENASAIETEVINFLK